MEIALLFILFLAGLLLIIRGGDILINSGIKMVEVTGISEVIIGATVVSLATTMPEMCVSWIAITEGAYNLAVGNGLGSMICNISLTLGVFLFLKPNFKVKGSVVVKSVLLLFVTLLLTMFSLNRILGKLESYILILTCFLFFAYNIKQAKREQRSVSKTNAKANIKQILKIAAGVVIGGSFIYLGAEMLVANGQELAYFFNVDPQIIGITVIALGTGLPELVTVLTAIKKDNPALSLGNIIGANILNSTLLFGVGGLLATKFGSLTLPIGAIIFSLPVLILCGVVLLVPILKNGRCNKKQGITLLLTYFAYILIILTTVNNG